MGSEPLPHLRSFAIDLQRQHSLFPKQYGQAADMSSPCLVRNLASVVNSCRRPQLLQPWHRSTTLLWDPEEKSLGSNQPFFSGSGCHKFTTCGKESRNLLGPFDDVVLPPCPATQKLQLMFHSSVREIHKLCESERQC